MFEMILATWGFAAVMFFALITPVVLFAAIYVYGDSIGYKDSAYHKQTGKSFISIRFNQGAYGEYLIYKHLREYEKNGAKFLFNVYVPKENGETTEIDVLLIDKSGIFVFESKNYSGWIFGSENQTYWTQTLPRGRGSSTKSKFYNPVLQNKNHIRHLKNVVGQDVPMYSIISFSDRCELKKVQICSDAEVINRSSVTARVAQRRLESAECLSEDEIARIYNDLFAMTQVDASVKEEHIKTIEKNKLDAEKNAEAVFEKDIEKPAENVCPRCGKALVSRVAKKGENAGREFLGCSGYPHCRYIKNI